MSASKSILLSVRGIAVILAVLLLISVSLFGQSVQISVDASKPGAKLDRNLFGQFAEHLGYGITGGFGLARIRRSRTHGASATTSSAL